MPFSSAATALMLARPPRATVAVGDKGQAVAQKMNDSSLDLRIRKDCRGCAETIFSSNLGKRRWSLAISCGSNVAARSLGTKLAAVS
jgi:hypothetical protein